MNIPSIRTIYEAKLTNGKDTYCMLIRDSVSKVRISVNGNSSFSIDAYFLNNFIKANDLKELEGQLKVSLNFNNKSKYLPLSKDDNLLISSNDPDISFDFNKVQRNLAKFNLSDYLITLGFHESIKDEWNEDIALEDLYKNKTNDYSKYENLINNFIEHDLNNTDFSLQNITTLPLSTEIIIPYFNSADTIEKVIYCISGQSLPKEYFKNLTITIIDDGSKQDINKRNLLKICEKNNFGLNVIKSDKTIFVGQARNIGYINSTRDIILTLDSDIILQKNYLINHITRHHLYQNIATVSNRENVGMNDPRLNMSYLEEKYDELKVDITKDSRYFAAYPADYPGGPGYEFSVRPLEDSNNFKTLGYNQPLVKGIDLTMMLKGHNYVMLKDNLRKVNYCANFFNGWGEDDGYLARKFIAAGGFIVPINITGVLHQKHDPRLYVKEEDKLKALKKNIRIRKDEVKKDYSLNIN